MGGSPRHHPHLRSDSPLPLVPAAIAEGGMHVHIPRTSSLEAGGQLQTPASLSPSAASASQRPIATSSIVEVRQLTPCAALLPSAQALFLRMGAIFDRCFCLL